MNTRARIPKLSGQVSARRTVSRHLVLFVLVLLTAIAVTGAAMLHIASVQDQTAREHARFYVDKALKSRIASSESLLRSYAFWSEAYRHLNPPLDVEWASSEDNIGAQLYREDGYELVCVHNIAGEEYVLVEGRQGPKGCAAQLTDNLGELRRSAVAAATRNAAVSFYVSYEGLPAIVSAALVKPTHGNEAVDARGPLIFFVDQLTPAKLKALSANAGVAGLTVAAGNTEIEGLDAFALEPSFFSLRWPQPTPGSDMLRNIELAWITVLVLIGAFLAWLIRTAMLNARAVDHYQRSLELSNLALEASEQRFKGVAEASSDWIWETDENHYLTYLSGRFEAMTGYSINDWLGRRIDDFVSCDTTSVSGWLEQVSFDGGSSSLTCSYRDSRGQRRICKFTATNISGSRGYRGTSADVTDEVEAHARIQHLSLHDALTGLPNRSRLASFMDELLADPSNRLALLMLDLDHFKPINDTLGHPAGDAVLQVIAERLRHSTRDDDLVARLGGDEFVIIDTQARTTEEVEALCQRVVELINRPIEYEGHLLKVGSSIGAAFASGANENARNLLRCADVAMYEAKAAGRNTWRLYSESMDQQLVAKKHRELELRTALRHGQLELYYQPRYHTRDRTISSVEALIRWNHPTLGLVGPSEFIGLAEESDLIVDIGEWVLREACQEAIRWQCELMVSVNVSPAQFSHPDMVGQVQRALVDTALPAERLELEITENVMLNDVEGALKTMHALKELGVRLNMDDFGTGYSSLGYLRTYPFDSIKIDQRFIASLDQTDRDRSIVQAIIGLGRALNLMVTAEGVETEGQLRILAEEGCAEVQGFFFSEPMPRASLEQLLNLAMPFPNATQQV